MKLVLSESTGGVPVAAVAIATDALFTDSPFAVAADGVALALVGADGFVDVEGVTSGAADARCVGCGFADALSAADDALGPCVAAAVGPTERLSASVSFPAERDVIRASADNADAGKAVDAGGAVLVSAASTAAGVSPALPFSCVGLAAAIVEVALAGTSARNSGFVVANDELTDAVVVAVDAVDVDVAFPTTVFATSDASFTSASDGRVALSVATAFDRIAASAGAFAAASAACTASAVRRTSLSGSTWTASF